MRLLEGSAAMDEAVVEALVYGDRERRIVMANGISNLVNKQRHLLAERGVIAPLISMLQSQDYEAIEAALSALLSIAFGSERSKIRIVKSGAINVLSKLLQCENGPLVDLVVTGFLIFSSCSANRLTIAASGAIQLLVDLLNKQHTDAEKNSHGISMQAKLDIMSTLYNLSIRRQIIPLILLSGTLDSLLVIIQSTENSPMLVEKATALLEKIVFTSEYALRQMAGMVGAIQALVETMEEGSPQCKEHAVGILLLMCKTNRERYKWVILKEGAMPGLLQLSVDGTPRAKELARQLTLLLRDCSSSNLGNRQSKNVLWEQVMGHIDSDERTGLRQVEEIITKLREQ